MCCLSFLIRGELKDKIELSFYMNDRERKNYLNIDQLKNFLNTIITTLSIIEINDTEKDLKF